MERFGGRFFLSMSGKRDPGGFTLAGVLSKTFRTSPTVERDPSIVLGKHRLNSDSQESSICNEGSKIYAYMVYTPLSPALFCSL